MEKKIYNGTLVSLVLFLVLLVTVPFAIAEDLEPEITEALNTGDTATALDLLSQRIERDQSYHYNYYVRGMIYFNQGKWGQARDQFKIAVDKKSNHIESWYQLGLTYLKLDNIDEAMKAMEKGQDKADRDKKYIFDNGLGLVAMAQEEYADASRLFQSATVKDSMNAEYWINLGDAYFYQGVAALAVNYYEKAQAIDTAALEVYYHWAEACLEMRDYTCAMEKLRTVLRKDSTHAPAWLRAGEIYFKAAMSSRSRSDRLNRFKETIGSYNTYLELTDAQPDSSNVRVFFELAMAYLNLNGFEDAIENFDKVLSIPYEPRDIYFYYGRALWGARDYVKSAEILEKHLEWVARQDEDYVSKISESELYQLLGDDWFYRKHPTEAQKAMDYTKAVENYKKSLAEDVDNARLLYNTAIAYHSLESYEQAIEYYDLRIAQGIDSGSAGILKNAGYCALKVAEGAGGGGGMEEEFEDPAFANVASEPADPMAYYELGMDYMKRYLEHEPQDDKIVRMVGYTYLYQMNDCENGVKFYERLLTIDADNCEAKRAIGYAYFAGVCNKNFDKAIQYLTEAHSCYNGQEPCTEVSAILLTAQAYHSRAASKLESKQDATSDFEQAYNWYGKVLKCEPNNQVATKGQADTQFEF